MLKLSENVYYDTTDEIHIIVDMEKGKFFELNSISHEIICLIAQNKSEEEIIIYISTKYNADIQCVTKDVKMFIDELKEMNLVQMCG